MSFASELGYFGRVADRDDRSGHFAAAESMYNRREGAAFPENHDERSQSRPQSTTSSQLSSSILISRTNTRQGEMHNRDIIHNHNYNFNSNNTNMKSSFDHIFGGRGEAKQDEFMLNSPSDAMMTDNDMTSAYPTFGRFAL